MAERRRPTKAELQAAVHRRLPDLIAPNLRVLFCGTNPGLYSAALGQHFARPGNRFWKAMHASGFTRRLLLPEESGELLELGLGLTDLVARASAGADELTREELVAGRRRLQRKVARYQPRWVAILGISAYRIAFAKPAATPGHQPELISGARLWVLPNPSGLNASHQPDALAEAFRSLRLASAVTSR
ncbi:MAG: G/U mismatch-specific DNA glycosylase [Gemmatimonadota bacterium]